MSFYSAVILMCVLSMAVMEICTVTSSVLTKKKRRQFIHLFLLIAFASVCEWSGVVLQGKSGGTRVLHIIVKTAELSVTPFIGLRISTIVAKPKFEKMIAVLLLFNVLLELLSAKFGFIFYVDADNFYHHAAFYWIYIAMYTAGIMYAFFCIVSAMRRYQYGGAPFLFSLMVFILSGVTIQMTSSSLKVDWLTISVGGILLYIFNAEMIQQSDALTMLINRRGYETYLDNVQDRVIILFFDVDKFKNVNDSYGHAFGDWCLTTIGSCIRECYMRCGKCFRIGGDEFCVVLSRGLDRVEEMNSMFFKKIEEKRAEESRFPYVSVGYVLFDSENNNIQDAVKEADEMMYKYKQEHRAR